MRRSRAVLERFGAVAALLLGAGCDMRPMNGGGGPRDLTVRFAATVGDEATECGRMYESLGTTGARGEILDLRFYVSNLRLINADNEEVPVTLEQDGKWQVEGVALLDFENGTGNCGDTGTTDLNSEVHGTVPEGTYRGLVFEVGVPFDLNHDDLAASPAPLNVSALFWTWAVGHQFLRVDLRTEQGLSWGLHLGSTMCESDGPTSPPISQCGRPNRPTITLAAFDPDVDTVVLDLRALFADSDLSQDTADTAAGCQSFPDDVNECTNLFPNLGLDFTTGQCVLDCGGQRAFTVGDATGPDLDVEAAIARGRAIFMIPRETMGER